MKAKINNNIVRIEIARKVQLVIRQIYKLYMPLLLYTY